MMTVDRITISSTFAALFDKEHHFFFLSALSFETKTASEHAFFATVSELDPFMADIADN